MTDMFAERTAAPMLIARESEPFDDKDCIFELKLDGERCLAYLDRDTVELRNKRNSLLLPKFRELAGINKQVSGRCILDGELAVLVDGKPSFASLLSRIMMTGTGLKAELARERLPACFTAFDIIYSDGRNVTGLPLMERKELLQKTVKSESERINVSRYVPVRGKAFFALAQEQQLEGIVAKRQGSTYHMGKRTTDWVKIKVMHDDDFVICGYVPTEWSSNSIILGKYKDGRLLYSGRVTLGVSGEEFRYIKQLPTVECPFGDEPKYLDGAVWVRPALVCTVKFMHRSAGGGMRQPVFKGLRNDKRPEDCI